MNIAVTGATGFIGSHMVPSLSGFGWNVTAIIEAGENVEGENAAFDRIRYFTGDIVSGKGLIEGLAGAEIIVHLAARNHILKEKSRDSLAEYRRVNVDGTRNVIRAAATSGAKLFLHFSSVKAIGEESTEILDEQSPCLPLTPYGVSKLESENVVRNEASRNGMHAIILRLPMVYGPGNKGNLPRMIRWAERGFPFPLFQPDNLRSMVYVENVVAGILAILKNAPAGTSTYILKDREDYSTRTVYSAICRELGKRALFVKIPSALGNVGGKISDDFRKVTGSFRVSSQKIEREIGFEPPFSLEEGIARTVRWYKYSA